MTDAKYLKARDKWIMSQEFDCCGTSDIIIASEISFDAGFRSALEMAKDAVLEVLSFYPEDIFPPDGTSIDSKSAGVARHTCANILNRIDAITASAEDGYD